MPAFSLTEWIILASILVALAALFIARRKRWTLKGIAIKLGLIDFKFGPKPSPAESATVRADQIAERRSHIKNSTIEMAKGASASASQTAKDDSTIDGSSIKIT